MGPTRYRHVLTPSFPTRPSSDLEMAIDAARLAGVEGVDWDSLSARAAPEAPLPSATSDDIAYLQYSSGSTRFPHGVIITHRALLNNLAAHANRSEEHTSELQSLMRISYAVFCLKKKNKTQ